MSPRVRVDGAVVAALILVAVFAYALFEIQRMSARSHLFPLTTAVPGLVVALIALVVEARRKDRGLPPEAVMTLRAAAWFAVYFAGMFVVGFAPTTVLFTFAYLWKEARLPWPIAVAGAVAGTAVSLIFASTLHVPLPEGLVAPLLPRIGG